MNSWIITCGKMSTRFSTIFISTLLILEFAKSILASNISCSYETVRNNGESIGILGCTGLSADAALTYEDKMLEVLYSFEEDIERLENISLKFQKSSLETVDAWISSPFKQTKILDKIKQVNLEGCNVEHISSESLSIFKNLYTLNLNSNNISDFEFFRNLTSLKYIYFSNNPQVNLDDFSKKLTSYGDIYRDYVQLADCSLSSFVISSDTNMYFVYINTIDLSNNGIQYVSNEYSQDRLNLILKGNSNLKSIGRGIFSILDLSDYNHPFDIAILNNVTVYDSLIIKNSNIETLDKAKFDINNILKPQATLDLSNSSIKYIKDNFFENVNFKTLNLSFNNMYPGISAYTFQNSIIDTLDLSDSNIDGINSLSFCNITTIRLNLSNNKLRGLGDPFSDCKANITHLDVSNNSLKEFEANSLENITGLISLNISLNPIDKYDNYSFANLKELKVLELTVPNGNNISSEVLRSGSLTNLTFRDSNITYFNDDNFLGLFNLLELRIENSTIGNMTNISLSGLFNLKYLDKNIFRRILNVSILPWYIFRDLHSMTELDLSRIYLINIDGYSFRGLENVIHLNLSNNFFPTVPQDTFAPLQNLVSLDLSYCYLLNRLPAGVFSYQKNLQYLSLRGNPTDNLITAGVLTNLENLIELDLSNNKWRGFDVSLMIPLQKLKILKLDYNRLTLGVYPHFRYTNLTEYLPNLEYIGISNNLWDCSSLGQMLEHFTSRNIKFNPDIPVLNSANIDGIGCTE